jgi:hypothetical protein
MNARNLEDPTWEPSDEDFDELLQHVGDDIRAAQAEVQRKLEAALAEARLHGALDTPE